MGYRAWERKKLNERPIYLRSVFFMLAGLQSVLHLYYDYDKVPLSAKSAETNPAPNQISGSQPPFMQTKGDLPKLVHTIILRAIGMSIFGPILYALFIRSAAWKCSLYVAALLWDVPNSRLSYIPPYHISLIIRSFVSGALLLTLWEFSNRLFSVSVAEKPQKKGQPLTSESKDPNGTLLIGLQSKREVPRVYCLFARPAAFADMGSHSPSGS